MTEDGHAVALLSDEITEEQHTAVLNRFRDGKEKLLITSSVCARAVDVEQVWKKNARQMWSVSFAILVVKHD